MPSGRLRPPELAPQSTGSPKSRVLSTSVGDAQRTSTYTPPLISRPPQPERAKQSPGSQLLGEARESFNSTVDLASTRTSQAAMAFAWSQHAHDQSEEEVVREFFRTRTEFYAANSPEQRKKRGAPGKLRTKLDRSDHMRSNSPARLSPIVGDAPRGSPMRSPVDSYVDGLNPADVGIREIAQLARQMNSPVRMEGIQEAKNMVLRSAQGTKKEQFAWLVTLDSCDNLLSTVYEYIAAHFELLKAIELKNVPEAVQLNAQELICMFGAAFFKTLLEASRRGEEPLNDLGEQEGFIHILVELVTLVTQKAFSGERAGAIERELNRVLSASDFTLEHSVQLKLKRKCVQRSAAQMVELTTVAVASELASLQIDKMLTSALATAAELVGCEGAWVLLFDQETGMLWHQSGSSDHAMPATGAGIAGSAAITKASIRAAEAKQDPRFNRFVDSLGPTTSKTLLAVPLMDPTNDECVGVIELSNKKNGALFADEDSAYLMEFGGHLAGAIRRSRQETTWVRQIAVDKSLHCHQETIQQAMQLCSVREVAELAADIVRKEMHAVACSVFVLDPEERWVWRAGSSGNAPPARPQSMLGSDRVDLQRFPRDSTSVVTHALEHKTTVLVSEIAECPFFHKSIDSMDETLLPMSILCVPLRKFVRTEQGVEEAVVSGIVQVINKVDGGTFTAHDSTWLERLSTVIATGLATTSKREVLEEGNLQGSKAIATSKILATSMTTQVPLEPVVKALSQIFDAEECSVFVKDGDSEVVRTSCDNAGSIATAVVNFENEQPPGLVVQCLNSGQLVNVDNAKSSVLFNRRVDRVDMTDPATSNLLAVPLQVDSNSDVLGVIELVNKRMNRLFTSADEELLTAMARTAATTVINSRKYTDLQHAHEMGTTLVKAMCSFSGKQSPETIVKEAVKAAQQLVGADDAFLFQLEDISTGVCAFDLLGASDGSATSHSVNVPEAHFGSPTMGGWGIAGHACMRHESIMPTDLHEDPRYNNMVDSVLGFNPAGVLAVPIERPTAAETDGSMADKIQQRLNKKLGKGAKSDEPCYDNRALGVLEVVRHRGNNKGAFTKAEMLTLEAFAQLVGVAIKSAREADMKNQGEVRARKLQALVEESSRVLLNLDRSTFAQSTADLILKHTGADQVFIYLIPETEMWNEPEPMRMCQLVAVDSEAHLLGEKEWPDGQIPHVAVAMGRGFVGTAAKKKAIQYSSNSNQDPNVDDILDNPIGGGIANSILCVPFKDTGGKNEVRGVIQLFKQSRAGIDSFDVEYVQHIASLFTVGCDNADRFTPLEACHSSTLALKDIMHLLSVASTQNLTKFPLGVISQCTDLLGIREACLFFYQPEFPSVLLRFNLNSEKKQKVDPVNALPLWGLAGQCIREDQPIMCNDVEGSDIFDAEIDCPNFKANRVMIVPIHRPDATKSLMGAISVAVDNTSELMFTDYSVYLLDFVCTHVGSLMTQIEKQPVKAKKGESDTPPPSILPSKEALKEMLKVPEVQEHISSEVELFELCLAQSLLNGDLIPNRNRIWSLVQGVGDLSRLKWSKRDFATWYADAFSP